MCRRRLSRGSEWRCRYRILQPIITPRVVAEGLRVCHEKDYRHSDYVPKYRSPVIRSLVVSEQCMLSDSSTEKSVCTYGRMYVLVGIVYNSYTTIDHPAQ